MLLKYNEDGKFRIMQFTDVHLGSFPFQENDKKTLAGLEKLVEKKNPNLLVFTGDIIYSLDEHGANNPKESFRNFIDLLNRLQVPATITFGNHDTEDKVSRSDLQRIVDEDLLYRAAEKHVFFAEDRKNYVVEIFSSDGKDVEQVLYVLDSGAYSNTEHSYYAWILPEQITWFNKLAIKYRKGDRLRRNLIFQHIPIPEYWWASQNIVSGEFREDMAMNLQWQEDTKAQEMLAEKGVCSPEINSGFFLQILLDEETWGMFVGHDHDNSFDGIYKGIHLVYGQCSGYNSYGVVKKGSKIIDLDEKKKTVEVYSAYFQDES